MRQALDCRNVTDANGNPTGGWVTGVGISINWQRGPLGRDGDRLEPNGAFVEGVIEAALRRLQFFQGSKFACSENQAAIEHLEAALGALDTRTHRREQEGTEGTHEGA